MTRREALRLLGAGSVGMSTASAALSGCAPSRRLGPLPSGARVVVVGAGFAGIAAAERLAEAGAEVVQIEAAGRIGGRAHTVDLGGDPVDLGAGWLHDSFANGLRERAEHLDLALFPTDMNRASVLVPGGVVPLSNVTGVLGAVEGAATGPYLRWRLGRLLGGRPTPPALSAVVDGPLAEAGPTGCALREMLRTVYASDPDRVSAGVLFGGDTDGARAGHTPLPSDDVIVGGGMVSLLRALVDRARPTLGEPCLAIERTSNGVRVRTTRRTIDADAAIVTVSVGVLKSGGIDLALPRRHREALDRLRAGSFEKVWLRYPERPWAPGPHFVALCDDGPFAFVVDVSSTTGAPLVVGLSTGGRTTALDALGPERAAEALHAAVRRTFGGDVPEPVGSVASAWGADPWVRGAYMVPTPEARMDERDVLREPIAERIFLAGEALSPVRFGLVDGAWMDGERAAEWIVRGRA